MIINKKGDSAIRSFLMRTFLRRPLFSIAIAMVCLIASGYWPGCGDRSGARYQSADGRRLVVSGTVQAREVTVNGYRLILDHLMFHEGSAGASDTDRTAEYQRTAETGRTAGGQETSGIYQSVIQSMNQAVSPRDRLQVFLSDGSSGGETIYGEAEEEEASDAWMNSSSSEDQTGLFETVRIGDRITLYGKCSQPETATNPGQSDSRLYCLGRRIILKMSIPEEKDLQRMKRNPLSDICLRYRNAVCDIRIGMQKGLIDVFGRQDAAQIAAFVLGDGAGLDSGTKKLFRDGGLSWLVCVSSLHISMLGMLIYHFLRSRGIPFLPSAAGSWAAVGSYAIMTGFSLSAQRALITFVIWTLSHVFGRTRDTLSALSAAVILILARQPFALWDCSFLMSCTCILSLEYVTPAITRIYRPKRFYQRKICSSLALWIGSFPAVLWFFYQTAPFGSMIYPVMLPLMTLFFGFGILGSCGAYLFQMTGPPLFLAAGRTCAWPCRILLKLLRFVCGLEQDLPCSVIILGRPAMWQMLIYYACLILFVVVVTNYRWKAAGNGGKPEIKSIRLGTSACHRRLRGLYSICLRLRVPACHGHRKKTEPDIAVVKTKIILTGIILFLVWMVCLRFRPEFRYTCLDIGQGSCNLIEHRGNVFLFDAGSSSVKNVWQYRIDSTLKYYGIRKVDIVFLSHGDMDHINGIEQMLDQYHRNLAGKNAGDVTIGQILVPELPAGENGLTSGQHSGDSRTDSSSNSTDARLASVINAASEHGIPAGYVREGTSLTQDSMTMKILSPSLDRFTGNSNEDCIVMIFTCRNLRILFMGDLEKEGETMFVNAWKNRFPSLSEAQSGTDTMVLVAGHHGSKNATSKELLDLVKPDLALISCGRNNRYGHPAPQMLRRLEEAGVNCRRTDLEGAVQICITS